MRPALVMRTNLLFVRSSSILWRAGVAHAGAQAAHHLIYGVAHGSPVRHAAFDAFGNELLVVLLEVTVLAAALHGAEAAHAAVDLELTSLIYLGLARRFLAACEHAAHHHDAAARGDGLDDVAGVLDAAVGNDGNAELVRALAALKYRADLRHADAGHNAGGADGAGAYADLDAVRARLDERFRRLGSCNVAGNELDVGVLLLDESDNAHDVRRMAVRAV